VVELHTLDEHVMLGVVGLGGIDDVPLNARYPRRNVGEDPR